MFLLHFDLFTILSDFNFWSLRGGDGCGVRRLTSSITRVINLRAASNKQNHYFCQAIYLLTLLRKVRSGSSAGLPFQ